MLRLYIIGLSILIIAIAANAIAMKLDIKSWYTFIELLLKHKSDAFSMLSLVDGIWLFILYPITLGIGYFLGAKLYSVVFG